MKIFLYDFEAQTPQYFFLRKVAGKLIALALIAAFVIPPTGLALAEEGQEGVTSSPAEGGAGEGAPAEPASSEEVMEGGESGSQNLLDSEDPADPPTISNPNTFTSSSQVPRTDGTGALVHRVPLEIPPGRNGLTPDLALVYNSQQLEDGIVGYGWSLSLPYIERVNKAGLERLYSDNYFTSSLGGELATTSTANEYRHRFEDGGFVAYTFSSNSWIAYDKKGTKYTFGASTTAQLYATTTSSNVYRWMLQEIRDSNNNYITYFYTRDTNTNQIYPTRILYTGNNTTDGIFQIDFTRATRTDPTTSYKTGFLVRTTDRITEIKASVSGTWVRKYTLSYTTGQNGARSLLGSVQLTGRDDVGAELSLPATAFAYSSTTPGYADHTNLKTWDASHVVADVDGNGLLDLSVFYLNGASTERRIDRNEYPSFSTETAGAPVYWASSGSGGPSGYAYIENGTRLFDATGDGKADIVQGLNVSGGALTRALYKNTSVGSSLSWTQDTTATTTIPMFAYQSSGGTKYASGLLGNANGDGLVDYVVSLPNLGSNMGTNGTYLHQGTSTALWTASTTIFSPVAEIPTTATSRVANELVDINGDGLDDWMNAGASSITFCVNTGSGWPSCSSPWNIATSSRDSNGWDRGIRFIDYNGDGLPDYVRSYSISYSSKYAGQLDIEKGTYNYVYLNTGSGFATTTLQAPPYIVTADNIPSGTWGGRIVYNEMVDWNGDGIPERSDSTSTTTKPDLLTRITYPTAGTTDVGYTFSAQSGLNPDLAFPLLLVASTTNSDGLGTRETTLYTYEGGKTYLSDNILDRRFAGFGAVTKTSGLGSSKTYYHQGDSAATSSGEQTDSYGLLSKPYREDVLSAASTTLKTTFYHWNVADLSVVAATSSTNTHSLDLEKSSSQYASIVDGSQTGLDMTGDFTIEAWVKLESSPSFNTAYVLASKYQESGSNRNFYLSYFNFAGTLSLALTVNATGGAGGNIELTKAQTLSTGTWYHVASTYDVSAGTVEFFVNGSSIGTTSGGPTSLTNGGADFRVGASHNMDDLFDGLLDDVRVWNVLRTGTEINDNKSNFELGTSANLKGRWKFDNAYTDASLNGNTLTANGSPVFSADVSSSGAATSSRVYSRFAFVDKEMVQDWEGGAAHKDTATEFTYATSTGNLTQKVERGEVLGASDGTYSDTGSDARFTDYTYATTSTNLSVVTGRTVKNNASTTAQLANFYYDNQAFGSTTKGNVTKEENWIGGSTYASTTKGYNTYGLIASSSDARSGTTTYAYDTYNLYPATTTNALGHTTGYLYDYAKGAAKRIIDANSLVRNFTFDPVGRLTQETQPDLTTPSTLVTSKTYTYTDTFPTSVQTRTYQTSATTSDAYAYKDGLGRTIQERVQSGGSNTYSVKDYVYATNGMLSQESLPYFASSSARTSATSTAALFTSYLYDALKRATSTANVVGTTSYSFAPWRTRVTDPNGNPKDLYKDAYGNLATVVEFNGDEIGTTTYSYDAQNNLSAITDTLANVRNFTYDGLSRRLTAQDLHDAGDGTYGTWNFAYDTVGNVASTSDPLGQVISYAYDALNRVRTEDYTGASGTEITYAYDTCTYGKLKLCSASSTNAYTSNVYNALGLVSAEAKRINNTAYASTTYSYDRQGNVTDVVYPNSREVHYGYDTGNRIADVATKPSGGSYSTILSRIQYGPHGLVSSRPYGNGVEIPYVYNTNELYRLSRIGAISGGVQSLAYTYDSNGNILTLSDASASTTNHSIAFIYDDLNRLTEASTTAATSTPFREIYRYNLLGNLLYKGTGLATSTSNTHSLDLERSSSQYASIGDGSQTGLDMTDDFTIGAWVKLESAPGSNQIYMIASKYQESGTSRNYYFSYHDFVGTPSLTLNVNATGGSGGNIELTKTQTLSTGVWYHVAVTYDVSAGTAEFFVNGSSIGTTAGGPTSLTNGAADFRVGASLNMDDLFDGLIDDVRVWARALSSSEITSLYTAPETFANGASLKGYWKFNNAYTDTSGIGNTLTGQNSPVFSTQIPTGFGANASDNYTYAETSYANPHALTGYFTGSATTTYGYNQIGNLASTTGAATSTYTWDYRNRMRQASTTSASSTYQYDHSVQRMRQTVGSTSTDYPNKFFSITSTVNGATTTATSTAYIWQGDTLVAYVEQLLINGVASGTPTTYYVLPDHLNSASAILNSAGTVVQALDYYPYGAARISTGSGGNNKRKFIGEFADDASSLDYLNARYYDPAKGQFLSEDPTFLAIGNKGLLSQLSQQEQQNLLADPQQLNSYAYGRGNPLTRKDATGNASVNVSGSFTAYLPGGPVPVGPMGGLIFASDGIYRMEGGSVTLRPGPSAAATFSSGNPVDGAYYSSVSLYGIAGIYGGGTSGIQEDGQGGYQFSGGEVGVGTPGASWDTYRVKKVISYGDLGKRAGSIADRVAGPLTNITTPSTISSSPNSGRQGSSTFNAQVASIRAQIDRISAQLSAHAKSIGAALK